MSTCPRIDIEIGSQQNESDRYIGCTRDSWSALNKIKPEGDSFVVHLVRHAICPIILCFGLFTITSYVSSLGLFGRVWDYLFNNPFNLYPSHSRFKHFLVTTIPLYTGIRLYTEVLSVKVTLQVRIKPISVVVTIYITKHFRFTLCINQSGTIRPSEFLIV